jgi:hypothetical protein
MPRARALVPHVHAVCAVLALAASLPAPAAADTTFGGDPTLSANALTTDGTGLTGGAPLSCSAGPSRDAVGEPPQTPTVANQTCTWTWLGAAGGDSVPFPAATGGSGTVTAVTLPAMANPGPMQVVVLTGTSIVPQGSQPGQNDFACCQIKEISATFTVPANQMTTVPLSLPVAATASPVQPGQTGTADILGVSMLGTAGASMPLHFTGQTNDYDLLYYPARSVTDPSEEMYGEAEAYEVLAQYTLSTGTAVGPAPAPVPVPAPIAAPGPSTGLTLDTSLTLAAKATSLTLGTAKDPPTASTTQTLTGVLPSTRARAARARTKKAKPVTLGTGKTTIKAGRSAKLTVRLTAAARRALARHETLTVTETITAKGPGGTQKSVRTLKLRQAAAKKKKKR